jgi:O-antigen/teichoic acid export membrane protein
MGSPIDVSKKLFVVNSISSVGARILNLSVLVWLQQHLIRNIDPHEYAIYPVVIVVLEMGPLFTMFLTGGITRYLLDAYARGDHKRVTGLLSSVFPLLVGMSLLLTTGGMLLAAHVEDVLTIAPEYVHDARIMLALLVLQYTLTLPLIPYTAGFYFKQRYVLLNFLQLLQQVLRLGLLFLLLFGVSTRVLWVVVASVSSFVFIAYVKAIWSRQMIPSLRFRPSLFHWGQAKEVISFGMWRAITQIADFLYFLQAIVLNKLGTPIDITAYYVGTMADNHVREMLETASEPIQPTLAAFHAKNDRAKLGEAYLRGGRYLMWAAMFAAAPLIIFSEELIRLYIGDEYMSAAWVIALMMMVYPFAYSNKLVFRLGMATGQIKAITIGAMLKQILNLGLGTYLIWAHQMGAVGTAIGILVSGVVLQVFFFWPLGLKIAQVSFQRFMNETVWPGMFPTFGAALLWGALKYSVGPSTWFELGLCTAVGYLPYCGIVLLCLRPYERHDLTLVIRRLRGYLQPGRA